MSSTTPSATRKSASFGQAPPENGSPCSAWVDLAIFLTSRRWASMNTWWPPARISRVQRVEAVGVEVVQHVADPVAGKSQPGDLRHAHALRRPQHHLRPPPRHHRPAAATHDPFQAIALVIADLTYSHPASHTRGGGFQQADRHLATCHRPAVGCPSTGCPAEASAVSGHICPHARLASRHCPDLG